MDTYRLNVGAILQKVQTVYQNGKLQAEQKDKIISLIEDGLKSYESKIYLGWYVKELLEKEEDSFFVKKYQEILQLITI